MTDRLPLFHGTHQVLAAGQLLTATQPCTYYPDVVAELEKMRPASAPSRNICLFATDSLAGAAAYLNGQQGSSSGVPHFYRVEMPIFQRAPFALIHGVSSRLKDGREIHSSLREYWAPTQHWGFWEYFGPSFTVIEEVPAPPDDEVTLFSWRYQREFDQASQLSMP